MDDTPDPIYIDWTHPDDYAGHLIDPFEIVSSCIFIAIGFLSVFVFTRLAQHHYRHGFNTHYQKIFFVCLGNEGPVCLFLAWLRNSSTLFQALGTFLIALNRASSIGMPHDYDRLWRRNTWRYITVLMAFSLLYFAPMVTVQCYFIRVSWGGYFPHTVSKYGFTTFLLKAFLWICAFVVSVTLFLNLYTATKLFAFSKKLKQREMTFHIATIAQFIAQLISTGDLILISTFGFHDLYVFLELQPVFTDLSNFLPLWFLLMISEETRTIVRGTGTRDLKPEMEIATVTAVNAGPGAEQDLVAHYSFMFRVRIPTWGFFEVFWYVREGFFPGLVSWMSEYCIMFQYLGTLVIALNRATALAFPYKYGKIWGRYTWHYIGITALIPLIYRAPSFTATSKFYRLGWGLYIPHTTENGDFAIAVQKGYYPICGVVIVLTLLVNLYTAFKLFTYTKAMHKRELRFHITTLAQFSAQLINTLELILVNTIYLNESYVIFLLQPIFADIANFLPLWVLLLISEETRLMVSGRHKMPSSVSVISVTESYPNIKGVR